MAWKVFYSDNTTCDSDDTTLEELPSRNVLAIIIPDDEVGRFIVSRWDYYYYEFDTWYGCDIFGLWDYLTRPGLKKVLFGRTVSNPEYREVLDKAYKDDNFVAKSAWRPDEDRSVIRK